MARKRVATVARGVSSTPDAGAAASTEVRIRTRVRVRVRSRPAPPPRTRTRKKPLKYNPDWPKIAVARMAAHAESGVFEGENLIYLVNLYLFSSLLYYKYHVSFMSDEVFDALCRYLHGKYDELRDAGVWWVGKTVTRGNLEAGTCLGVTYPTGIVMMANEYLKTRRRRR